MALDLRSGHLWTQLDRLGSQEQRVASVLRSAGSCTQAQVATMLGVSRPTVSLALANLRDCGLVAGGGPRQRSVGRSAESFALVGEAGYAVGAEIGHYEVRIVIADVGHRLVASTVVPLDLSAHERPLDVVAYAARTVTAFLREQVIDIRRVVGVHASVPAPVADGRVLPPSILKQWANAEVLTTLHAELPGVDVRVENDGIAGALGEYVFGAGKGSQNLLYIKLANGIGGGIVQNGRIVRGAGGTAGEVGHVTLDPNGDLCGCGNVGCLELYAGGRALLARARAVHNGLEHVSDLVKLALDGDRLAVNLMKSAAESVGMVLGSAVNILGPDRIVFGGDLAALVDLLLEPAKERLARHSLPSAADACTVVIGELKQWASAWGGVAAVLRAAYDDRVPSP